MPNAGDIIKALDFTDTELGEQLGSAGTTTSTSYTATLTGATTAQVAFVAPTSGKVKIDWRATLANSGANATLASVEVREGSVLGSGTAVVNGADSRSIRNDGTTTIGASASRIVAGLTPGASYNAQIVFRVTGGTGTFSALIIIVTAQP